MIARALFAIALFAAPAAMAAPANPFAAQWPDSPYRVDSDGRYGLLAHGRIVSMPDSPARWRVTDSSGESVFVTDANPYHVMRVHSCAPVGGFCLFVRIGRAAWAGLANGRRVRVMIAAE